MADGQLSNTPHPTPPRTEEDRLDWLRLIRSRRVGAVTFHRLMAEHGSARAALAALPSVARAAGVTDYSACPVEVARDEVAKARVAGAQALFYGGPGYPALLMELPDAPPVLWVQGNLSLLERPMVALVGARNASSLGVRMARRLAEGLGQAGFTVVSGLARGIDSEAHMAAMATGTVAVQAGGVDVVYPEENAGLAEEIRRSGLRLSEQPMGLAPQTRHFPLRNRIIAGLAHAVVVVEAAARSGSLITARAALDQGREVLAVPGHPFDARASGCNLLIRDGATLVRSPADVLEALGQPAAVAADTGEVRETVLPGPPPAATPSLGDVTQIHNLILDRLGPSPLAEDQLIRDLALPAARLAPELLALELEGRIRRQPGGLLSRT
ncbi:DNA-processing protein DprA [Neotabrizicola sp. VNH66]|uniref:DNA-processing protein DprA n=1 Tax=Neotabrizicola sp. VNH66 TaxID=3400918 RepID=UPI003C038F0A